MPNEKVARYKKHLIEGADRRAEEKTRIAIEEAGKAKWSIPAITEASEKALRKVRKR